MNVAHKNKTTPPTTRIRRVVFDHANTTIDLVVFHRSSIVISSFGDDMIAIEILLAAMGTRIICGFNQIVW